MRQALKIILAIAVLVALLWLVDIRELIATLSLVTIPVLVYFLFISVVLIYVSALKWKFFLTAIGNRAHISMWKLFRLYLVGYFVNLLFPSYVGGDALRSFYIGREVGQHQAAAATVLERYTGLVAMVMLALVFMWFSELTTPAIKGFVLMIAAGIIVLTAAALSPRLLALLTSHKRLCGVRRNLEKIQMSFHLAKSNRTLLLRSLLLSFLYHSLTVINTMTAAYAVGWTNAPGEELFVVLPIILLLGAVPITPSGLGIQEGAFVYFLKGLGASGAEALGLAILLRAKSYVLAIVGWVVWLGLRQTHSARKELSTARL